MTVFVNGKLVDVSNNSTENIVGLGTSCLVGMAKYVASINISKMSNVGGGKEDSLGWEIKDCYHPGQFQNKVMTQS